MAYSINFIERKYGDSPSIERVFRCVGNVLSNQGIEVNFQKLPFGNGITGIFRNLLFFKPLPADIYHLTGHANYMALVLPSGKTLLTVHDLTLLSSRGRMRRWILKWLFFKWPVRRLKYITAISENTRIELAKTAGIDASTIRVVENPLLIELRTPSNIFDAEIPLILQVGTAPNKNIPNLVRALRNINCRLWIIGLINPKLRKLLVENEVKFENNASLNDDEMLNAYAQADIVTLCSTIEGFGLPIIEAQAFGKPVVTSNLSPMKDVAGDGAVFVNPSDSNSIADGITRIINESDLRKLLVEKGLENVKRYSPVLIAKNYRQMYEEIIERSDLMS